MSESASSQERPPGGPGWREDLGRFWGALPHKPLFFGLAVAWVAFFHFLGNSTFGYKDTGSLFVWLEYVYAQSPDDEHGRLIPFVVLALLWWKREELIAVSKRAWWPAFGLVVAGMVLHLAGFVVQQTRVSLVGFLVGLYGLTGLVWGREWLKATFFPGFLFVFCLPVGTLAEAITFPLRMLVTVVSVGVGSGLGVDVVRNGTQILGAGGSYHFDVAPACSGIRSLTALTALTTIYGFMHFRSGWKRLLMVLVAVPVAVLGNVVRITGMIVTAEAFGQEAGVKFHDSAGFVVFAVAIVCVLGLGHWLREPDAPGEGARTLEGQPA
jgi:exosortase